MNKNQIVSHQEKHEIHSLKICNSRNTRKHGLYKHFSYTPNNGIDLK